MHQLNHHHLHRDIVLKTHFHIEDIVVSGIDKHTTEKVDALIRQGIILNNINSLTIIPQQIFGYV
jgi:hypothetical protein